MALLIDTDVHEPLRTVRDLLPYLDPHWQVHVTEERGDNVLSKIQLPYSPPGSGERREWRATDDDREKDLERLRSNLLEGEGVTAAILNGFFHVSALPVDYEFATALAAAYNDWQIHVWLEREPRLRGSVHVIAHNPEVAAREIDRVAEHPQIVQVFLPLVNDRQYGDPHYHPIFEAAVRNDLVVTFHHGSHTRTVLGYPRHFIEWHTVAAPQAAQNQLLSLICNGVFDRYPDLKVVFLETGVAWVPWFMWRLDQQYREMRREVPWVSRLPSEIMRDSVRVATQPMGDVKPQHFEKLVEMTDTERVYVFATDYPHYDADTSGAGPLVSLPEQLSQRIRYQNAVESFPRLRDLSE